MPAGGSQFGDCCRCMEPDGAAIDHYGSALLW